MSRNAAAGALLLLGAGTGTWTWITAFPLFVHATPAGTLEHFQALRGFAQNLAVVLALPGLGRTVGAAGVRPSLAGIAALLLLTAACRYRSDAQPHHCA